MTLFLSSDESRVYALISGRDSSHPIPLVEICQSTGLSPRAVKGIVEALRTEYREPIGASRKRPSGYFICVNPTDIDNTARPMFRQAINMIIAVRSMVGKQQLREWMGQERLY